MGFRPEETTEGQLYIGALLPESMPLDAGEEFAARFPQLHPPQRASHVKIEWLEHPSADGEDGSDFMISFTGSRPAKAESKSESH